MSPLYCCLTMTLEYRFLFERNNVNRAWHSERFIIDFFFSTGMTLIGTDSIIKIKPGMQWTLMKLVWRNRLIYQSLLAYLIMTNNSVIIFKRINSFASIKTHQSVQTMLVLIYYEVTITQILLFRNYHIYVVNVSICTIMTDYDHICIYSMWFFI